MKTILGFIVGCFFFAGCAGTTANVPVADSTGTAAPIPTTSLQPDGAGPFPAVVIMHDCSAIQIGRWRTVRQAGGGGTVLNYYGAYQHIAPLLILVGELDDWAPAEPYRRLTENARQAGYPVTIKIYPGAHHAFDNNSQVRYVAECVNLNAPTGRGATTGGHREAWDDSLRQVSAFFAQHLRKSTP